MIIDLTEGYLDEVRKLAQAIKKEEQLAEQLLYLHEYACHDGDPSKCVVLLRKDFAPASFSLEWQMKEGTSTRPIPVTKETWKGWSRSYKYWMNGGLIWHGRHDAFGSGGAPTFSVCLTPTDGWSIHT